MKSHIIFSLLSLMMILHHLGTQNAIASESISLEAGFEVFIDFSPWPRANKQASRGDYDLLFPCAQKKEREVYFSFSDTISTTKSALMSLKGKGYRDILKEYGESPLTTPASF